MTPWGAATGDGKGRGISTDETTCRAEVDYSSGGRGNLSESMDMSHNIMATNYSVQVSINTRKSTKTARLHNTRNGDRRTADVGQGYYRRIFSSCSAVLQSSIVSSKCCSICTIASSGISNPNSRSARARSSQSLRHVLCLVAGEKRVHISGEA